MAVHTQTLACLVTWTMSGCVARMFVDPWFYGACLVFQSATLYGIVHSSRVAIQTGHAGFAGALYVGAMRLPLPDVYLIRVLATTAILTRRWFRGCLFDLASPVQEWTSSNWCDVFFLIPIALTYW